MKKIIVLAFFTLLSCSTDTPEESIVTPITYTLTVSASEGGTIDNTGGTQNENVDVIITAIPVEGYIFLEWSGSADGTTNPLTVSMTTDKSITANFTRIQYTLNLFKVGEGTISQEIISATRTSEDYNAGTSVRLNATPSSGWIFSSWSGSSTSTANPIDLIIDKTKTITATFVECTTVTEFFVTGNLSDPADPSIQVKSLSPDCSRGGLDGRIWVVISGGLLPYTISWFVQDTLSPSTATNPTYRALPEFDNRTSLDGLLPGSYKMEVASIDSTIAVCENGSIFYEEIIEVVGQKSFYRFEGPFVDADLCSGNFGRLEIEVFDNNNGNLSFYYNGILIPSSDVIRLNNYSWSVAIVNAIESADFKIINEEGCSITTQINRGIGNPNFTYTSPSFLTEAYIRPREEVTFTNVSTDPYVISEWIFGDNTSPILVYSTTSITPVRHTYGVSGTYSATLRIYNYLGCSEEVTETIVVVPF